MTTQRGIQIAGLREGKETCTGDSEKVACGWRQEGGEALEVFFSALFFLNRRERNVFKTCLGRPREEEAEDKERKGKDGDILIPGGWVLSFSHILCEAGAIIITPILQVRNQGNEELRNFP